MPRTIWKGAVGFGLVHIPVALVAATRSQGIDFDWLDSRSMDPVGYKRINKVTGKEIDREHIVKGVEYEKGRYVVISEEEIRAAHPKATQTVEIVGFVEAGQIPTLYLDTPYYLMPERRGEKVYALLREALVATGRVGLAQVVIRTRQHLALLMPMGEALVLNTMRWGNEVRSVDSLELSDEVRKPSLNKRELDMAKRLIEEMSEDWDPQAHTDSFQEKIMALVEEKADAGHIETVADAEAEEGPASAEVVDLTELLRRSLGGGGSRAASKDKADKADKPAKSKSKRASSPRRKAS